MGEYKTEQEQFWAGAFGDAYIDRNDNQDLLTNSKILYAKILSRTARFRTLIEFGANVGLNVRAIHAIDPSIELSAIEINAKAAARLGSSGIVKVYHQSMLDFEADYTREFVLISGVLIHINPEVLPVVYRKLYATSSRYILLAEYYNPTPVEVPYRGHSARLFKRDFAGEMMDMFPDLRLVDYGFEYVRDGRGAQDDSTWFLLEKTPGSGPLTGAG